MLTPVTKLFRSFLHLWRGFPILVGGSVCNYSPTTYSPEKQWTSGFPGAVQMAQKASRPCPIHPSVQETGPWGRRREERKPFSASQHAHSLQHGEGPVGGQCLSHGPGTVVPDPVALEAVEARRGITGGAQEGARQALTPHTQGVGELALPTAALASGFPWVLQAPACWLWTRSP